MDDAEDFQPEIKFRWCRTVRCRAQTVHLVLTSVTGTQVPLIWQGDLGWYESEPTPVPCGFHTGFILVKDRVRDFVKDTLETREADYKVDPFHIVPHKFAVELFLESDEATSIWSEAPELRLRYLSSDHLEKLGRSFLDDSSAEESHKQAFSNRKWVSSTALHLRPDRLGIESSSLGLPRPCQEPGTSLIKHTGSLGRGKSHSQLSASSISLSGLCDKDKASTSSPNLSKAFQVAVDLSRASSKFLAGVSSTSSGVFLGYEDGSGPPSPENGNYIHTDSAYAAGGETSQESESGEGAKKRKKIPLTRGRSLQIEDLVEDNGGSEAWRPRRFRSRYGLTDVPSSSYEDLLESLSASKREVVKSELNLMKFETLKRERLVKEILQPSDSDFEDEEAPCEGSNPDLAGPYQCVITFESRSASMDDVGSPRALEDVLVSLTSNDESHQEVAQPQPLPRTVLQPDLLSDESALVASDDGSEEKKPTPKPRTITPIHLESDKSGELLSTQREEPTVGPTEPIVKLQPPSDEQRSPEIIESDEIPEDPFEIFFGSGASDDGDDHSGNHGVEEYDDGDILDVADSRQGISDIYDDNFQYDSLKHDDNENLPIDIRNIDSEESLDILLPKATNENMSQNVEHVVIEDSDNPPDEEDDESEGGDVYEVEGAEAAFSSIDGEVPTDSVALVPLDSYKGTVREVKDFERTRESASPDKGDEKSLDKGDEKSLDKGDEKSLDKSDKELVGLLVGVDSAKNVSNNDDKKSFLQLSDAYVDNGETDRSETEEVFDIGVSDIPPKEFEEICDNGRMGVICDKVDVIKPNKNCEIRSHDVKTNDQLLEEKFVTGVNGIANKEPSTSSYGFREPKVMMRSNSSGSQISLLDSDSTRKHIRPSSLKAYDKDEQNTENHKPFIRPPRLLNTSTQTATIRQISRTTSIDSQKFSDSDSANERTPSKYGRSPLRNRTNGQAETYTPLPDRLSGPWSHRFLASTSSLRHSPSPGSYAKPELMMLQRNLYNLVQGDDATKVLQNTVHLQKIHSSHTNHEPRSQSRLSGSDQGPRVASRASTSEPPLSRHSSPKRYSHHYQSADHNHYHISRSHYTPLHRDRQSENYSTPYQYKYPLLSTSVIKTTSPSTSPYRSSVTSGRISRAYSGSVSDLSRMSQRTKYDYVSSTTTGDSGGVRGVRPASSLPDLRQPSSATSASPIHRKPVTSSTYSHIGLQQGPRHAQSVQDIMVGRYGSSRGKRVTWREWQLNDQESDSGDSTDSLIDEAEKAASNRINLLNSEWGYYYGRSHQSRRRRTRSHQGFSAWRDESEPRRSVSGSRPYLPYRGDQLSPGQQVKVLAPGGGVALARVVTNQRSAFVASKSIDYSTGVISPAAVTVILMSEPNRLQGTVVTVPLEKVLLAWPRA